MRAYDFVEVRAHDGRKFCILAVIDKAGRECVVLVFARQLNHENVLLALTDLFFESGPPTYHHSKSGSKVVETEVK